MSIAAYIKVIGRGKDGARPLNTAQARDLFEQVLDGKVTDLEIGAFCLAMRIKGETVDELDGFVQASLARCIPLADTSSAVPLNVVASKGIVVLPSYNGARKLPNLTALLAWMLAQRGVNVLVHGASVDPTRVTTAQIFDATGLPTVASAEAMHGAWREGKPAFMDIATLSPSLGKLLAVRWTIGLRNPGHTVAKLLDPFAAPASEGTANAAGTLKSIRVVNHTHPEYAHSLTGYLRHCHADALLMRGTEGEPVADARRQPKFEIFIQGQKAEALSRAPVEGVLTELPALPASREAQATADYIREVTEGRLPLPASIDAQADCLIQALARLSSPITPAPSLPTAG
jgi:anthranilate phosphoribosyltransferase